MLFRSARILGEGYALRASDIDLVYLNGYGFPAYRGGPMHFADSTGVRNVYQCILELNAKQGADWEPAPLLARLAEADSSFKAWDDERSKLPAAS